MRDVALGALIAAVVLSTFLVVFDRAGRTAKPGGAAHWLAGVSATPAHRQ